MSKGSLRRVVLTGVVAVLALSAMTCASPQPSPPAAMVDFVVPANNCATGIPTTGRERPIVCIENVGGRLVATPPSIEAWDVLPSDRTTPNVIHWVARGGGSLTIQMKDPGCVQPVECNAKGHCRAKPVDITTPTKRCRYGIILDGVEHDPDTVIVDCC